MPVELRAGEHSFCFRYNAQRQTVSPLKVKELPKGERGIPLGTQSPGLYHYIKLDRKYSPELEGDVIIDAAARVFKFGDQVHHDLGNVHVEHVGSLYALGLITTGDAHSTGEDGVCVPLIGHPWLLEYGRGENPSGAYLEALYKITRLKEGYPSLLIIPQGKEPHVLEYRGQTQLRIYSDVLNYLNARHRRRGIDDTYSPELHLKKLYEHANLIRKEMRAGTLQPSRRYVN